MKSLKCLDEESKKCIIICLQQLIEDIKIYDYGEMNINYNYNRTKGFNAPISEGTTIKMNLILNYKDNVDE